MRNRESRSVVAVALGALAALAPPPAAAAAERVDRFQGTARDRDGAVLYLESHDVRSVADRLRSATTTYRDPAGRVLAVLHTDFSRDPFAPSYRFEDRLRGAVEEVEVSAGGVTLGAGSRRRTLALPGDPARRLVAGQGLDRFVRDRLDALEAGAELKVAFAIPSRQDAYEFRVRAVPGASTDATVRVRVEIDSWVLRIFASSLDVEYDRASRRLLRYRGLSNLTDERGENPEVEITYAYPEEPRAAL
jgi:hypothetical protein